MKKKADKTNTAAYKLLFTALLLIVCAAIYLFTESGYNKEPSEPVAVEIIDTGVFVSNYCDAAFSATAYKETSHNVFEITDEVFDEAPEVVLSANDGIVKAFTLNLNTPCFPIETEDPTPIEQRLFSERKDQYYRQREWIDENLTNMIKALDAEERLTQSDILFILHTVDSVIQNGKQQKVGIAQYNVRIYIDEDYENSRLSISMQDDKIIEKESNYHFTYDS